VSIVRRHRVIFIEVESDDTREVEPRSLCNRISSRYRPTGVDRVARPRTVAGWPVVLADEGLSIIKATCRDA